MKILSSFNTFILLLLVIPVTVSLLTSGLGFGYIEKEDDSRETCEVIDITMEFGDAHVFLENLQKKCAARGRINRTSAPIKTRKGRAVILAVGGVVAGATALTIVVFDHLRNEERFNSIKKQEEIHKNITQLINNKSHLTQDLMMEMEGQINNNTYEHVVNTIFGTGDIEVVTSFFKVNLSEILHNMGFDDRMGLDAAQKLSHKLVCGHTSRHYQLQICGTENPTRRFGEVKLVAPPGNYGNKGTMYSYYKVPKFVVFTDGGPVSAISCQPFGNYYNCIESKGNCGYNTYKRCPVKRVHTPNSVYATELGDATVVASAVDHYSVYENGSDIAFTDHKFPASGQLLIRAPHTTKIRIGNITIQGRHDFMELKEVHVSEQIPQLDHAKLEEWMNDDDAIDKAFSDLEKERMHANVEFEWGLDSILHWFKSRVAEFISALKICAAGAIVIFIIYCLRCCYRCSKKATLLPN
ncbi:hypothetical protein GCK72_021139 [Caenorhabditis remanei]|uniref:Uncharacterized protein n=2 Tax=Caenorhabditis remanei TaxID=31234 RepID=A0A6A5GIW4_CAERE|nr:hypothetical protein GCK72_021139 [Caenorhabditis remanei]KAF1754576.1 hypothetical protein GCK72_021139 [Caenorhabditis remanei]